MTEYSFTSFYDVTPSNTAKLNPRPRALHVTTAGAVAMEFDENQIWTITVENNTTIYLSPTRIRATGTTAAGIRGLI